jgi:branched-chain amino acid transport system ATP-binding protein
LVKVLLDIHDLTKNFGGLVAVNQFSMSVAEGEIVGLIGPNGAGKTTVFNLVTGVIRPSAGKVEYDGKDVTGKSPHFLASSGIGRTFQLTPLFTEFTTLENVVASYYLHPRSSFWDAFLNTPTYRRNEAFALEQSLKILELVGLSKVKDERARNLPHGYQKMLGIARALAVQPRLLLLDEPLGGMNTDEIAFTMDIMAKVRDQGMTILVIEHNMQILDLCDRVVAINFGQKIGEGTVDEVRNNPDVITAYLGEQNAA